MTDTPATSWERHRFHADPDDWRPITFPTPGPFWCSGYGDDYSVMIAYLPAGVPVTDYWPEAIEDDSPTVHDDIVFTARFPQPDWWPVNPDEPVRRRSCRICGCTDDDCSNCIDRTSEPCSWVEANLCSACTPEALWLQLRTVTGALGDVIRLAELRVALYAGRGGDSSKDPDAGPRYT